LLVILGCRDGNSASNQLQHPDFVIFIINSLRICVDIFLIMTHLYWKICHIFLLQMNSTFCCLLIYWFTLIFYSQKQEQVEGWNPNVVISQGDRYSIFSQSNWLPSKICSSGCSNPGTLSWHHSLIFGNFWPWTLFEMMNPGYFGLLNNFCLVKFSQKWFL